MTRTTSTNHLSPVWSRSWTLNVERGEGAYLFDTDGRRYLDFTCGIGVTSTGHAHPVVVKAIQEQAARLLHGQANIVTHQPMLRLVARASCWNPRTISTQAWPVFGVGLPPPPLRIEPMK